MAFLIGFVVGFFGVPQRYCYQAFLKIDKTKGATLYDTTAVIVLLSDDYLNELESHINDKRINRDLLRKSISIEVVMSEPIFTVTFAVKEEVYATEIGKGFESFSVEYLNENVKSFKNTLILNKSTYYKTNTISKALLSSVLCAVPCALFAYLTFTTINKDRMILKQVKVDEVD